LNLTNGTLAYHLKTLEMQNFIKYKRVGLFKCFYPIEYKFGKDETRIKLSNLQQKILNEVETKPGITQKELISKLKGSQQNISYNLKIMERNDILRAEEVGRIVKYYPPKEILHTDT
jgi:predicted transcriptional regulator